MFKYEQVKPMIIHFGDSSSDDEEVPQSISVALDNLLKQARKQTEQTSNAVLSKSRHSKVYNRQTNKSTNNLIVRKGNAAPVNRTNITYLKSNILTSLHQKYQAQFRSRKLASPVISKTRMSKTYNQIHTPLKRKASLLDISHFGSPLTKEKLLHDVENKYLLMKNGLTSKNSKLTALTLKQNRKQLQFKDARKKCREAHEAYMAAQLVMQKVAVEVNAAKSETKKLVIETRNDRQAVNQVKLQCQKLGREVNGAKYSIPYRSVVQATVNSARKRKISELVTKSTPPKESLGSYQETQKSLIDRRSKLQLMEKELKSRMQVLENSRKAKVSSNSIKQLNQASTKLKVQQEDIVSLKKLAEQKLISSKIESKQESTRPVQQNASNSSATSMKTISKPFPNNVKNQSVLAHLHSHRFRNPDSLISPAYANNIKADHILCLTDLFGSCSDKNCKMQHRSAYLLSEHDRIVDALLYDPSVANIDMSVKYDNASLRKKLSEFVSKYLKQKGSSVSQIWKLIGNSEKVKGAISKSSVVELTRNAPRFVLKDQYKLDNAISKKEFNSDKTKSKPVFIDLVNEDDDNNRSFKRYFQWPDEEN